MQLVILGLGAGDPDLLTPEASRFLSEAAELYLRSWEDAPPALFPPGLTVHTFDDLLSGSPTPGEAVDRVASALLQLARRPEGVVYAVPGHPQVGGPAGRELRRLCTQKGIPYRVIPGVGLWELASVALGIDPVAEGLQLADATAELPDLDTRRPAMVFGLGWPGAISLLQEALRQTHPPDHPVVLLRWGRVVEESTLEELPAAVGAPLAYLPPVPLERDVHSFGGLRRIVGRLRGPGGCPWDRQQTHESLKSNLLEETYEVLEALDSGQPTRLREELGDLLMQVLMHTQIAEELREFTMAEVVASIASKLVRRHPHVFGEVEVSGAEEVLRNWEAIKTGERNDEGSPLESIPRTLPALAQAQALLERAARHGLRWPTPEGAPAQLGEALGEVGRVADAGVRRRAFGRLLLELTNLARQLGIDAEDALRSSAEAFRHRYARIEEIVKDRHLTPAALSREELVALWQEAGGDGA